MSETAGRPIRKFNPGTFQSDQEVIEQFVVRQHQLRSVLDVVRGNIDSPSCQHVLLVAPRGRGKTMLLARVAAELRTDRELSRHLLPVRFMEESPEIFDMADFWLETLFHLARESARQEPRLARELRASYAELSARWRDRGTEDSARATVLSAADRLGKKLVLMVESMQSLVRSADRDLGWKLRAVLQSEPQIMLLASSTSRFEGLGRREPAVLRAVPNRRPRAIECPGVRSAVDCRERRARSAGARSGPCRSLPAAAPPAGHCCRLRPASVAAEADGRAGGTDRRAHRVLPRPPGILGKDRAARLYRGNRPLAAVEARGNRSPGPHGHPNCVHDARPSREARRGAGRGARQEAFVHGGGETVQHLLQASARTRRSGCGAEPDSLHDRRSTAMPNSRECPAG